MSSSPRAPLTFPGGRLPSREKRTPPPRLGRGSPTHWRSVGPAVPRTWLLSLSVLTVGLRQRPDLPWGPQWACLFLGGLGGEGGQGSSLGQAQLPPSLNCCTLSLLQPKSQDCGPPGPEHRRAAGTATPRPLIRAVAGAPPSLGPSAMGLWACSCVVRDQTHVSCISCIDRCILYP